MLLVALATALAAPLSPVGMQSSPLSIEVAGNFNADRVWLRATSDLCEPAADVSCTAVRQQVMQGGEIDIRPVKWLGVYAAAAHTHEVNSAVIYTGSGFSLAGGVKATLPLGPQMGLDAWAEGRGTKTWSGTAGTSTYQTAVRIVGSVGADVHFGSVDDDIVGWLGANVIPFSDDHTKVLDYAVDLGLVPAVPGSIEGGFLIISSPMGGPWMERGRLGAGASASLGYSSGVSLWLSGSY